MATKEKPFQYMTSEAMKPEDPNLKQQILLDVGGIVIELAFVEGREHTVKAVLAMMKPHLRSMNQHLKTVGVDGEMFSIRVEEFGT